MRKHAVRFFALVLTAFSLFSAVSSQGIGARNRAAGGDGQYGLQGRVYLPDGKPAQNASVVVNSIDSISLKANTDHNGMFHIGGLGAGNYSISVTVAGFPVETETVTIDRFAPAGRTFAVVVNMSPEPREAGGANNSEKGLAGVPRAAADSYLKGVERIRKNDPKGAVPFLEESVAAYPAFTQAYFELGTAYLKQNNLDKALDAFVKVVNIDKDHIEAKYSVGYVQYLKKNYEVASAVFVDVLKQRPKLAEGYLYLGLSLYYLKDIANAESALKAALSLKDDADTALAHRFLGGMYLQKNRNAEAAVELQRYLELVPSAPDAARLRSTIEDLKRKS